MKELEKLSKIKKLILDVDGTLTDGGIYIMDDGSQFKKFNARDGMGIMILQKAGIEVCIISASMHKGMVESRAKMLGIQRCYVGKEKKDIILKEWLKEWSISADEVAYVGDDVNDLDIMKVCGFTACPADAMDAVLTSVDRVLNKKGGKGAVRELSELLLKARKEE